MAASKTALSHNIKFLRKVLGISQEELANRLNIKRSNIAAYESKNVEPRLRIILEIARIFNIEVSTLIENKLDINSDYRKFNSTEDVAPTFTLALDEQKQLKVEKFIEKSVQIRKVLEGFKSFYSFRKNGVAIDSPERERVIYDIDNFIQLMDHLLKYNENVIAALASIKSKESA
jgi:transcriptional regulator with XRE-family HTH domain